jgi:YD repeat-containing protein
MRAAVTMANRQAYDALGRVVSATNSSRPGDGLNFTTTYGDDPLGRTTDIQTADGSTTTAIYSGNQVTAIDPAGKQRRSIYDALGRLTSVFEDPSGANYTTNYGYDALDDLIWVSQGYCPNCQGPNFTYASLQRMTRAANPESGTVSYVYDAAGNPDFLGRGVLFRKAEPE